LLIIKCLFWHPVVWLFQQALEHVNTGLESSTWILLACLGIPVWVVLTRLVAELPGIRTGKMHLWWAIFAVSHIWGILAYLLFERLSKTYLFQNRFSRRIAYADRTPADILASPFEPSHFKVEEIVEDTGLPEAEPPLMSPLSCEPFSDPS